jgi:hypothetical protein
MSPKLLKNYGKYGQKFIYALTGSMAVTEPIFKNSLYLQSLNISYNEFHENLARHTGWMST